MYINIEIIHILIYYNKMFISEKFSAAVGRGIHFSFSAQSESCRDSATGKWCWWGDTMCSVKKGPCAWLCDSGENPVGVWCGPGLPPTSPQGPVLWPSSIGCSLLRAGLLSLWTRSEEREGAGWSQWAGSTKVPAVMVLTDHSQVWCQHLSFRDWWCFLPHSNVALTGSGNSLGLNAVSQHRYSWILFSI